MAGEKIRSKRTISTLADWKQTQEKVVRIKDISSKPWTEVYYYSPQILWARMARMAENVALAEKKATELVTDHL